MSETQPFTNRLIEETSPYLRQHAHNPVNWYPWGPEALEKARRENKPIFLSIGYSACHWCHVMEHESFEDSETAALMNEHFVNVKVDREERPDLDHIYMAAVQMMTRHGGWPMSVFLTTDLEPFYGGTYFPPQPRYGMPSFKQVLIGVSDAWRNRRAEITRSAGQLASAIGQMNEQPVGGEPLTIELIDHAVRALERDFDPGYGGFGAAPKFPHPMDLKLLLRHWKRAGSTNSLDMVRLTLDHMARGGIYDHLGGGFHRYSTDERWLVPHFEKMLYDNAQLAQVYLEAFQATHDDEYARIARETLDYVLREMTAPDGGFYATQDADSERVEGKFFVWSLAEVEQVLGPASAEFAYVYDVSNEGNWEGHNILNRPKTLDQCAKLLGVDPVKLEKSLSESRRKLFHVRSRRISPGRDDKVLVAWNGLMIDAMARGYQVLGDERYLAAARRAAEFILATMWRVSANGDSRGAAEQGSGGDDADLKHTPPFPRSPSPLLLHSHKDGRARFNAYLDDYAALVESLITLYEADFDPRWLVVALEVAEVMIEQFWDEAGGSFLYTGREHETLIARVRDVHDSATPSGNSLAATALLRLGRLAGRNDLTSKAERTLQSFANQMRQLPRATGQMLVALDFLLSRPCEIVIVPGDSPQAGDEFAAALRVVRDRFMPNKVVAALPRPDHRGTAQQSPVPLVAGKKSIEGKLTVYVCENLACQAPLVGVDALKGELIGE